MWERDKERDEGEVTHSRDSREPDGATVSWDCQHSFYSCLRMSVTVSLLHVVYILNRLSGEHIGVDIKFYNSWKQLVALWMSFFAAYVCFLKQNYIWHYMSWMLCVKCGATPCVRLQPGYSTVSQPVWCRDEAVHVQSFSLGAVSLPIWPQKASTASQGLCHGEKQLCGICRN